MASYFPPKINTAFIMYIGLESVATAGAFQSNPTLAAGDCKVSIDGGTLANLATLPVVTPGSSKMVKVSLSSGEMNGENITLVFSDAAGSEWKDLIINIQTSARQIDDLSYPTVSGRSTDVSATGEVGIDWANIGSPTATVALSGTTAGLIDGAITAAKIAADAITAAKIADGAIDAATFAAGAINAAAIASDAITDAKVASDVTIASVTGAVGSVTGNVGGNVVGSVASVTAGVTVTTNNDKTGYRLSATGIQDIWDALTTALTTVGSIGKLLVDNINATINSRSSHTAANVRTEMDSNSTQLAKLGSPAASISADIAAVKSDTANIGTAGAGLTAVASAANLTTLTNYVDTEVAAILAAVDTEIAAIKAKTDTIPASPAATGDIPSAANIATAVWGFVVEGSHTAVQVMRGLLAVMTGKSAGGGTTTVAFRDASDSKNRVSATVDADGNRTSVTTDFT